MNIRERNMVTAIWFLSLLAVVAVLACFGLAQKLGRCERDKSRVEAAYEAFMFAIPKPCGEKP